MRDELSGLQQGKQTKNVKIISISAAIGVLAGVGSVLYRYALTFAEEFSFDMYEAVGNNKQNIPILFIALAILGYGIGALTRKVPLISGSGIPQVKAQISGYIEGKWLYTILAKFLGGTAAILGGLSLGREGPSIQLGACVADFVADEMTDSTTEKRIYLASGASAGLAAAFNAPLAGVMFALEEIFKYFSPMVLLSTMVAAVFADFVSKMFFGIEHVFHFDVTQSIEFRHYWLFILLGIILGVSGVIYNVCLIKTQKLYKNMKYVPVKLRPVIPFIVAGILGLIFPVVLCGGHSLITELHIETSVLFLCVALIIKFLFSMVSFGAGAPGGIFFPLLVLGSTIGAVFAQIVIPVLGMDEVLFYNFIIISMAGYFAAIVRAPLTGIILMIEMTGSLTQLLPLIVTSAVAYIVAEEMDNKPIYESLLETLLIGQGVHKQTKKRLKILIESVVQYGAEIENTMLKDINMPKHCLIVSIRRGEHDITPNGKTMVKAGDYLIVLTSIKYELDVRPMLEKMCSEKK